MTVVVCLFFLRASEAARRRDDVAAPVPRAGAWPVVLSVVLSFAVGLAGCAADEPAVAFCEPVVIEDLDPLSVQHILPGAEVSYLTSPPTSGAHLGGGAPSGTLDEPVDEPMQVTILEGGRTLVQYQPGLATDAIAELRALGSLRIVVAPNPTLDSPVVATRWRAKLTCAQASPTELVAFSTVEGLPKALGD